jgi:hypothetical protein
MITQQLAERGAALMRYGNQPHDWRTSDTRPSMMSVVWTQIYTQRTRTYRHAHTQTRTHTMDRTLLGGGPTHLKSKDVPPRHGGQEAVVHPVVEQHCTAHGKGHVHERGGGVGRCAVPHSARPRKTQGRWRHNFESVCDAIIQSGKQMCAQGHGRGA